MKKRFLKIASVSKILVMVATFFSFSALAQTGDLVSSSPPFDPAVFRAQADEIFGGIVKGYSLAVVRNGVLVGTAAGGVDAPFPFPVPMDVSTPCNVGSTVKMASTVALLSFFEKDPTASVEE